MSRRKPRAIGRLRRQSRCRTCQIPELPEWIDGCIEETRKASGSVPQAKALWHAVLEEFEGFEIPNFYTFQNHLREHSAAWKAAHPKSEV